VQVTTNYITSVIKQHYVLYVLTTGKVYYT